MLDFKRNSNDPTKEKKAMSMTTKAVLAESLSKGLAGGGGALVFWSWIEQHEAEITLIFAALTCFTVMATAISSIIFRRREDKRDQLRLEKELKITVEK